MRILHYLHGMPPVRKGGLVKYVIDLAVAQSKSNDVVILYPGSLSRKQENRANVRIRKKGKKFDIRLFVIHNSLPIPMGNGIQEADKFMLKCNKSIYLSFLQEVKPDVIQMHSLMGIHVEFLIAANELNIPIVYTTHDYYGLCPTINMFCDGRICTEPGQRCHECSVHAYPDKRMVLEQSELYRFYCHNMWLMQIMQWGFVRKLFKSIRSRQDVGKVKTHEVLSNCDYSTLLNYYKKIFSKVDYFHFNSYVAKRVYENCLGSCIGEVLLVSNSGVKDRRSLHKSQGKLKIGFLGGDSSFKGLDTLLEVCSEVYEEGKTEIELQIYGSVQQSDYPFCKYHKPYGEKELDSVFQHMDVLAVPSKCPETFAMVALEAIAHGVPVLLTECVGAGMLVEESDKPIGRVLEDDKSEWKACICELYNNRARIQEYSQNICDLEMEFDYCAYVNAVQKMLEKVVA